MLDRLLAALTLIVIIGLLLWNAIYFKAENITLKRTNNLLELKMAEMKREMPWFEALPKQRQAELNAGIWKHGTNPGK